VKVICLDFAVTMLVAVAGCSNVDKTKLQDGKVNLIAAKQGWIAVIEHRAWHFAFLRHHERVSQ